MKQWCPLTGRQEMKGRLFSAMRQQVVKEARLARSDKTRKTDRRKDITHRIMSRLMGDLICAGQLIKPKTWNTLGIERPYQSLRPKGSGHASQLDDIPSGIPISPLPGEGIHQIPKEGIAGDLIVKTKTVVAKDTRLGLQKFMLNTIDEIAFTKALFGNTLRRHSRQQAGIGMGEHIRGQLGVKHNRISNCLER
jgi:hypothetical protein